MCTLSINYSSFKFEFSNLKLALFYSSHYSKLSIAQTCICKYFSAQIFFTTVGYDFIVGSFKNSHFPFLLKSLTSGGKKSKLTKSLEMNTHTSATNCATTESKSNTSNFCQFCLS